MLELRFEEKKKAIIKIKIKKKQPYKINWRAA
jgi:hypothetical protein